MAVVEYDFKKPLLDLDDTVVKEDTVEIYLNELLAHNIGNSSIKEDIVLKFFGWALDLKKTGKLQLDEDDREKLKKWILANPTLPAISKGRMYEVLK